jgi:AcrR family transcriptional regulator
MAAKSTTQRATRSPTRSSSDERRDQVIEAAVEEFAANGFHATSTSAIAKRAGISQPYIYALFPNKRELFLAVDRYVVGRIRRAFAEAARGLDTPEERLDAMGQAYLRLLENRDEIRFQMQAHASAGDPELGPPIRKEFKDIFDDVARISGASPAEVSAFMAKGMLLNVAASLGLGEDFVLGHAGEAPADAATMSSADPITSSADPITSSADPTTS